MRSIPDATAIALTEEERAELEGLARSLKGEHHVRLRARIVLLASDGAPTRQIARTVGCNVILAAPDLDVDVFASQWRSLGDHPPQFTIFVSRGDRALALSRSIAGNAERLGRIDPDAKPWLSQAGIEVIDLTGQESADIFRHAKFADNPEVVRFLGAQLINGDAVSDSSISLGERARSVSMGVAQSVSGAAALAIGAPIAVVDPDMRRSYSEQANQLMRAADNAVTAGFGW
jgi:esterase/lipase superfamily enzyme